MIRFSNRFADVSAELALNHIYCKPHIRKPLICVVGWDVFLCDEFMDVLTKLVRRHFPKLGLRVVRSWHLCRVLFPRHF